MMQRLFLNQLTMDDILWKRAHHYTLSSQEDTGGDGGKRFSFNKPSKLATDSYFESIVSRVRNMEHMKSEELKTKRLNIKKESWIQIEYLKSQITN